MKINRGDCSFHYTTKTKLDIKFRTSIKEVQLDNGAWLYYKLHTYSWSPPADMKRIGN